MSSQRQISPRVIIDGKFFRSGTEKFHIKGVTYGPFTPDDEGETFGSPEQVERDFRVIGQLGANLVRVYYVPPRWFLDLAAEHQLKVLVDVPWATHLCFLDSRQRRREARQAVHRAVAGCAHHPALFGFSLANEIPAEIVRWSGVPRVEAFIDELVNVVKSVDAESLCSFTCFPPTEYLRPESIDYVSYNLYLHEQRDFEVYLGRLQMLADAKPLILAELGMDSLREGEARKSEFLRGHLESAFRRGLAGAIVFSFTDDWFRGGMQIEDWAFGLTDRTRCPKPAFEAVRSAYEIAPRFPLHHCPKVSVVVASYNGAATLRTCLESLTRLNYPDYEVILVDDGSKDNTLEIARQFPDIRMIRHENKGLSAARNTGIDAAAGEIIAFTDSDCRADEDWLYYLVGDLLRTDYVGVGGPNLLPNEDSLIAAAVMVSPGGPAHVMLTDTEAEHIPGCNMAFYAWALKEIGGFDPVFRKAGDDVDVCWRLQQRGYKIGFSPSAFVWHYRRSTVAAYLEQQNGYGEAEALLQRKHPNYFNFVGRSIWTGRIYSSSRFGVVLGRSVIYHGLFGTGLFQRLYAPSPSYGLMFCTSLEYHGLVTGPLLLVSVLVPWLWPLFYASLLASLGVCALAAAQANLAKRKRRFWSRPLVALLFFLQPIERGLARYRSLLRFRPSRRPAPTTEPEAEPCTQGAPVPAQNLCFWSDGRVTRQAFLNSVLESLGASGWQFRPDTGWGPYHIEITESRWSRLRLITAAEQLDGGRMNFRCRFRSSWSPQAKVFFWSLSAVEAAAAALVAPFQPWAWMLLLTLPLLAWFIEYRQSELRNRAAALLGSVAGSLRLSRVEASAAPASRREQKPDLPLDAAGAAVENES